VAVTQVDLADRLYAALQAPELSKSLERLYRERGVDVILGDVVTEFRGSGGKLTGAVTKAGREIEAELAIVGVGVQPSTGYLEGSGVELERGTVVVDDRFASSVPGIWAVGDVANFEDPIFGHRRLIQHWTNANHQGDRLGRLLAGQDTPYDQVAFFFSEVFGTKIGLLGDLDGGHDELITRGSLEEGSLLGWYLRESRLVAALIIGQTPELQNELNALLRVQAPVVDRAALTDPETSPGSAFTAGG
jgi:NADPH-dependent 2,4-dienoyl-CoA reductase/sulfur reductase-like enzyme